MSHFPLTNARAFAVRKRDGERVEFGKRLLLRANLPRLAGGAERGVVCEAEGWKLQL